MEEMANFREKSSKASDAAHKSWESRRKANAHANASANADETHMQARIQSPEGRKDSSLRSESQRKSQGSRLPQGWSPTPEDIAFAQREGFTDDEIASIADDFTDYWIAHAWEPRAES